MMVSMPETPGPTQPHGLVWGIRKSFVEYVGSLDDGTITARSGALTTDDGAFSFAAGEVDLSPDLTTGTMSFNGDVILSGHEGMMHVRLLDPVIELVGSHAVLSVAADTVEGTAPEQSRIVIARLYSGGFADQGDTLQWRVNTVLLTDEGAALFGKQYPSGQMMDEIVAHIPKPAA